MNILGYSAHLNDRNSNTLDSLNSSIEELMEQGEEKSLKRFEMINFSVEGSMTEGNLKLKVTYKIKGKKTEKTELFSSHVDKGAIDIGSSRIMAYFGETKHEAITPELDAHGGEFDANYLEINEPDLYNQLCEEYLLACTPNTQDGAEFCDSDAEFFSNLT